MPAADLDLTDAALQTAMANEGSLQKTENIAR